MSKKTTKMKRWKAMINAKAEENVVTINIHDNIGHHWWKRSDREEGACVDVEDLQKLLDTNKSASRIDVYINSAGGDVTEGIAIYNILKRTRAYKRVFIDGFACSIASVIAMAGNSVSMPKSSMQMIHNAWTVGMGNANELRKIADDLEKINEVVVEAYMSKFKGTREELHELLDNESYLTAEECLKYGLCTKIVDDSDETEEDVNEALDEVTGLFANKLKSLEAIKNAIKDLDEEIVSKNKKGTVKESEENKVAKENVKEEMEKIKVNALQSFFNYKPERGN